MTPGCRSGQRIEPGLDRVGLRVEEAKPSEQQVQFAPPQFVGAALGQRPGELADAGEAQRRPGLGAQRGRQALAHEQAADAVLAADPLRDQPFPQADERLPLPDVRGGTATPSISPTAASRASLRASSRSVLRLTCFHCQAAPVVLATTAARPSSPHRSWTQPAWEQASKTTGATAWPVSSRRRSSGVVATVRNAAVRSSGWYQHKTQLNLPRSMAKMVLFIACLPETDRATLTVTQRHAWILSAAEGDSMGVGSVLQSRAFGLAPATYLSQQDGIFDAAVEAVLRLGEEFIHGFPRLGAIETKATTRIDGCLLLWGIGEADNPHFLVIEAKRVSRWLFKAVYRVTVHWAIPDEAIAPVLRLCDLSTEVPATHKARSEPLVVWLSKRLPDKQVVGCNPGYFATLEVAGGEFGLAFFTER